MSICSAILIHSWFSHFFSFRHTSYILQYLNSWVFVILGQFNQLKSIESYFTSIMASKSSKIPKILIKNTIAAFHWHWCNTNNRIQFFELIFNLIVVGALNRLSIHTTQWIYKDKKTVASNKFISRDGYRFCERKNTSPAIIGSLIQRLYKFEDDAKRSHTTKEWNMCLGTLCIVPTYKRKHSEWLCKR